METLLDFQMDTGQNLPSFVSAVAKQIPQSLINASLEIDRFTLFNNWQFRKFFCSCHEPDGALKQKVMVARKGGGFPFVSVIFSLGRRLTVSFA